MNKTCSNMYVYLDPEVAPSGAFSSHRFVSKALIMNGVHMQTSRSRADSRYAFRIFYLSLASNWQTAARIVNLKFISMLVIWFKICCRPGHSVPRIPKWLQPDVCTNVTWSGRNLRTVSKVIASYIWQFSSAQTSFEFEKSLAFDLQLY